MAILHDAEDKAHLAYRNFVVSETPWYNHLVKKGNVIVRT